MKTVLKITVLSILLLFGFAKASSRSLSLLDFSSSQELLKTLSIWNVKSKLNFKDLKVVKNLADINSKVYSISTVEGTIFITEIETTHHYQVYFFKKEGRGFVLIDNGGYCVARYTKNLDGNVSEFYYSSAASSDDGDIVSPSPQCVRQTVAVMKEACNGNDTCSIACDLMSTACVAQMYIVASAYCASHNNQGPQKASTDVN